MDPLDYPKVSIDPFKRVVEVCCGSMCLANLTVGGPLIAAATEGSSAHSIKAPSHQPAGLPGLKA